MAYPVVWPKKSFFYPIGNTPPVCFTRDISPDEKAEILLLASGDPRSILYTVHADPGARRALDFTCCDWESAILARNIILLTMIVDEVPTINMWSIFYHFYLDEVSFQILLAHCRSLVQSASDIATWKASKYGNCIRFCTEDSLAQIRRHWDIYKDANNLGSDEEVLREAFATGMKSATETNSGDVINVVRAAGPLGSTLDANAVGKTHSMFWSNGVAPSNSAMVTSAPYINLTFAYSLAGRNFNVHYATDPILVFFAAPALASIEGAGSSMGPSAEDLFEAARRQFASWCASFKMRIDASSPSKVIICFFVGEAFAFCRALYICKEVQVVKTTSYVSPWGGTQIDFDEEDYGPSASTPASILFSVIDTSNLSDHMGLFNVLIATVPLLQCKASSVLYTDTLRAPVEGSATVWLKDNTLADIPTLSLLLGITPSPYLWHFTTHSSKHEFTAASLYLQPFHESLSWRLTCSRLSDSTIANQVLDQDSILLICDPKKLAEVFFSIYLRMFDYENEAKIFRDSSVVYVRATFASFRKGKS